MPSCIKNKVNNHIRKYLFVEKKTHKIYHQRHTNEYLRIRILQDPHRETEYLRSNT